MKLIRLIGTLAIGYVTYLTFSINAENATEKLQVIEKPMRFISNIVNMFT